MCRRLFSQFIFETMLYCSLSWPAILLIRTYLTKRKENDIDQDLCKFQNILDATSSCDCITSSHDANSPARILDCPMKTDDSNVEIEQQNQRRSGISRRKRSWSESFRRLNPFDTDFQEETNMNLNVNDATAKEQAIAEVATRLALLGDQLNADFGEAWRRSLTLD